ncbi:MAG: MCE family protein [Nitrospirae bacterium]|nr:MAG: MCE family protein [Nitrospirota bacterium]
MPEERFKGIEIKVGAVVVIAIAIFVGSLLYVGYSKDLFAPKIKYFLRADSGQDLSRGMPVKFSGFQIGSVTDLMLEEDGSMRLKIKILEKYGRWIRLDSEFLLAREGMIGSPVIILKTGKKEQAPEGTEFVLKRQKGLEAIADEVKPVLREVAATISEIHKMLEGFNNPEGNFQKTLANLERATRALNEGKGAVRYVIHDPGSKAHLQEILKALEDLSQTLQEAASSIGSAAKNIDSTVTEINTAVKQLQSTIKTIQTELEPTLKNLRTTSEELPVLRQKVDYTLELSKDLVLKLHNTWPLNRQEEVERRPKLPAP